MEEGYVFYYGWARKIAEEHPFVNRDVNDTIGFLISFDDWGYRSEEEYKKEFRQQLEKQKIKISGKIDVKKLIDLCAQSLNSKCLEFKPGEQKMKNADQDAEQDDIRETREKYQLGFDRQFEEELKPSLFSISRIFVEAHKQMTIAEYKTFALALSQIDWTKPCPDTLYIDKKKLAKAVGINSDANHLSQDLKRSIGQLPRHSYIEFDEIGKEFYVSGNFVRTIIMQRNLVRIRLENDFLGLFGNLDGKSKASQYIKMWSGDIFELKSERAVILYEYLRDQSDSRCALNCKDISTRKLKELFDIPKDGPGSYMRKNGFDRSNFEKYVLDPICAELSKTRMVKLAILPNGKYYEKLKKGMRVVAYEFKWVEENPKPLLKKSPKKENETDKNADSEADQKPDGSKEQQDDSGRYEKFTREFERPLWIEAVDEFHFTPMQLEAIEESLLMVPHWCMYDSDVAHGSRDLDQYNFLCLLVTDMKAANEKKPIHDKCRYLIKMIRNKIPPAMTDTNNL